jgi:hypothetical protein
MKQQYPFQAYDRYLTLRPGAATWLVLAYLIRPYAIMAMSLANKRDRWGLINLVYQDRSAMALSALAAIPALLLIYAYVKRKPGVTGFIRQCWHRGRLLLFISLVLNIVIVFVPVLIGKAESVHYVGMLQAAVAFAMLMYVAISQRLRDTFADYPEPTEQDD